MILYMTPEKFKNSSLSSASMTLSDISHRDQISNRVRDLVHLAHLHLFVTVMPETRYRMFRKKKCPDIPKLPATILVKIP